MKITIKKLVKLGLATLALFFILINVWIHVVGNMHTKPPQQADSMIILGAQVINSPAVPNLSLQERLDAAIPYLQANPQTRVIVSGGQGQDESATEASVMKHYLMSKGIAGDRIFEENSSRRTAEQFVNAKQFFTLGKTIIVTSDYHLLRSLMLAKRSGLDSYGLTAPSDYNNIDKYIALYREPLALIHSYLFDHPSS